MDASTSPTSRALTRELGKQSRFVPMLPRLRIDDWEVGRRRSPIDGDDHSKRELSATTPPWRAVVAHGTAALSQANKA